MEKGPKNGKQVGFLNSKFLTSASEQESCIPVFGLKNSTISVATKRALWAGDLLEVLFGACIGCIFLKFL